MVLWLWLDLFRAHHEYGPERRQSIVGETTMQRPMRAQLGHRCYYINKGITIYWVKILLLENSRGKSTRSTAQLP